MKGVALDHRNCLQFYDPASSLLRVGAELLAIRSPPQGRGSNEGAGPLVTSARERALHPDWVDL